MSKRKPWMASAAMAASVRLPLISAQCKGSVGLSYNRDLGLVIPYISPLVSVR